MSAVNKPNTQQTQTLWQRTGSMLTTGLSVVGTVGLKALAMTTVVGVYTLDKCVSTLTPPIASLVLSKKQAALINRIFNPSAEADAIVGEYREIVDIVFSAVPEKYRNFLEFDPRLRRIAEWLVYTKARESVGGFIEMTNDLSEVSESAKKVAENLFGYFEEQHLKNLWAEGIEFLRSGDNNLSYEPTDREDSLTPEAHGFLRDLLVDFVEYVADPFKSPKLYKYVRGKIEPLFLLTVQELLNEGKRLQAQDHKLGHLDDNALILLGAGAIGAFVGKELLKDNPNPQEILNALGNKYPGFKNINLPKELVGPFLNAITEQAIPKAIPIVQPLTALTSELPEINQDLVEIWGEGDVPSVSKIYEPITAISELVSTTVSELLEEKGNGSIAEKATALLNENGYAIEQKQVENVFHAVASSDAPELSEIRVGIDTYIEATVKEIFVRLGKKADECDGQLLTLVQNIIIKTGFDVAQSHIGGEITANNPQFYKNFTLDLLRTLGLNGPEDLIFIPELARSGVWDVLSGDVIGNKLKDVMEDIFNPGFIRQQIIEALDGKTKVEPVNDQAPTAAPQARALTAKTEEETARVEMTENAFKSIYKGVVTELLGDGMLVNIVFNNKRVVKKVGKTLAELTMNTLVEKYGDETGKPSLKNLIADALLTLAPTLRATEKAPLSAEQVAKNCEVKRLAAVEKFTKTQKALIAAKAKVKEALKNLEMASQLINQEYNVEELESQELDDARSALVIARNEFITAKKEKHVAELNAKFTREASDAEYERSRQKMVELIENLPRSQAQEWVNGLWSGFQSGFNAAVKHVYKGELSPTTKRFFKAIGEVIFLKVLGSIITGSGYLASLFFKRTALRLDRFLENNKNRLKNKGYDILEEVQVSLLNGAPKNVVRKKPSAELRAFLIEKSELSVDSEPVGDEMTQAEYDALMSTLEP